MLHKVTHVPPTQVETMTVISKHYNDEKICAIWSKCDTVCVLGHDVWWWRL